MLKLLPALQERGHEVAFAGVHNTKASGNIQEVERWMDAFRDRQVPVLFRRCSSYLDPGIPLWLWRKFSRGAQGQKPFDLMHTHLIYADFWASCIRVFKGKGFPAISTVHGYEERTLERFVLQPSRVPHNLYWHVFNTTRRILPVTYACSLGLKEYCAGAGIHKAAAWPVIEHGFDFYPEPPAESPECRTGKPQIAVVGRLIQRKGVHLALESMVELQKIWPDIKMVIVGSGPEQQRLESMAEALQLSQSVLFTGFDPHPLRWMLASDLVLIPSYAEGLPLVIFEAFHARKPVVAFETVGCRDMLQHAKTGLLARPFDPADLAAQMMAALQSEAFCAQLTSNAQMRLQSYYTLSRMVDETEAIYRETLNVNGKTGSSA